jgi:hypothetical protein
MWGAAALMPSEFYFQRFCGTCFIPAPNVEQAVTMSDNSASLAADVTVFKLAKICFVTFGICVGST